MDWTVRRLAAAFLIPANRKATLILVYMALALGIWKTVAPIPSLDGELIEDWGVFFWGARKIFLAALLFGLIPAGLVKFAFRENLSNYGVQCGNMRRVLFSAALLTPIMAAVGYFSGTVDAFYTVYPLNPAVKWSLSGSPVWMIVHSIVYLLFYYYAFEFFFRGFLLRGLSDSCGLTNALLIQAAACLCFHFGHPACEMWGSFAGSLFWGYIVLRNDSILSTWVQHAALGIGLDVGLLAHLAGRL